MSAPLSISTEILAVHAEKCVDPHRFLTLFQKISESLYAARKMSRSIRAILSFGKSVQLVRKGEEQVYTLSQQKTYFFKKNHECSSPTQRPRVPKRQYTQDKDAWNRSLCSGQGGNLEDLTVQRSWTSFVEPALSNSITQASPYIVVRWRVPTHAKVELMWEMRAVCYTASAALAGSPQHEV